MDQHDLATAYLDLSDYVSAEKGNLMQANINDPRIPLLENQFQTLQYAASQCDAAWAQALLSHLQTQLDSLANSATEANTVIRRIADINDGFHFVASVVATAAALGATVASGGATAGALISSAQALYDALSQYAKGHPSE